MILYFTGTGNSLAVARRIAEATGDRVMAMAEAAGRGREGAEGVDLSGEEVIGLVYPCYDFNTPPAVREMVEKLKISPKAYVFVVITCGAQTGNSIWTVRRLLKRKGVDVAYCHKIRMPDNSATLFGRNPNDQLWKLEKFAPRLEQIIADVKARRKGNHFGTPGLAGWLMGLPAIEKKMLGGFRPAVNQELCVACGLCARVCPIGNIAMTEGGKAQIGDLCTSCLACLHACPQQAIRVGDKPVPKECQYHHPDIKIADLQRK